MANTDDTFQFTPEFQDLILAAIVRKPADMSGARSLIKPAYFQSVIATVAAQCIFAYDVKYGSPPSFEALTELVKYETKKLDRDDDAVEYVRRLKSISITDTAYVRDRISAFAKERATQLAVLKAIDRFKEGKYDNLTPLFAEAENIGNLDDMGYVAHADVDRIVDKVTATDYGVATGYPQYDRIWRRGWQPGWLIVLLAPPKRYKTCMCINLALNMVGPAVGEAVLYYACEISAELATARMYCNIAQVDMNTMYDDPARFKKRVHAAMADRVNNYLVVKSFPSGGVTIGDIDRHATAVEHELGIRVKAIFIDYAETIAYAAETKGRPEHEQQASIYLQARALATKHKCAVIMPDRINRESVEKSVPSMTSFQGAFKKAGIVDAAIGLCATEEEYAQNVLRTFVFINRHGPAFQHFRGKVDPETMTIDVGSEIEFEPEDQQAKSKARRGKSEKDEISRVLDED